MEENKLKCHYFCVLFAQKVNELPFSPRKMSWTATSLVSEDCLALSCWSPKTGKSGFQIFYTYLAGSVRWSVLLSTLLAKGISGTTLQWFESYLSDRSFKVPWRGEVSKSQHLTTGVPQGSVLGPLLFCQKSWSVIKFFIKFFFFFFLSRSAEFLRPRC